MYGTQTYGRTIAEKDWFENDVKIVWYSNCCVLEMQPREFENDVKMYGTQTHIRIVKEHQCLRMM